MAVEFNDVKETVKAIVLRLDSPSYDNQRYGWWVSPQGEFFDVDSEEDEETGTIGHVVWAAKHIPFPSDVSARIGDQEVGSSNFLDRGEYKDFIIFESVKLGWVRVRADPFTNMIYIGLFKKGNLEKRLSDLASSLLSMGYPPDMQVGVCVFIGSGSFKNSIVTLKGLFPEGLPNSVNQSTSLSSSNNISGSLETNKDK